MPQNQVKNIEKIKAELCRQINDLDQSGFAFPNFATRSHREIVCIFREIQSIEVVRC